jgi:hypothetical protein
VATFSSSPKPGFIYSASDDTWYEISAKTDTTSGYEWGGTHSYLAPVNSQYGINNFLNAVDRDIKLPTPHRGTICVIRQDPNGNDINEFQLYDGIAWTTPITNLELRFIMGTD